MLVFFLDKFVKKWRLTKLTYFLIFVVAALFSAFFFAWRDEHFNLQKERTAYSDTQARLTKLELELNDERKRNSASFQGEIMYASWASPEPQTSRSAFPIKLS